jgi:Zinc knuckle
MLQYYRNKALDNDANAYPQTLTAAYRIASGWVLDEKDQHRGYRDPPEVQSAFVTDSVLVAKAKATLDFGDKKPSGKERRRRPLSEVICYSCRAKGHYARDCKVRPRSEDALIAYGNSDGSDSDNETAYMTTDVNRSSETALFSADEVLIDSQASVNIFNSQHLLRNIRKSQRPIVLNGVQSGASGVAIDMEGDFNELGAVFYSKGASANILSLAQLVDSGAGPVRSGAGSLYSSSKDERKSVHLLPEGYFWF